MRLFILMSFNIASLVCGQLLMKYAMVQMGGFLISQAVRQPAVLMKLALNPYVVTGLLLYGVNVFLWFDVLSTAELSYVYPMLSLSYGLVVLASALIFHEGITPLRLLGVVIICLGVYTVARS
ncbi:MAG: multidrug resistance protein [Anaerolineae bacterium]